MDEVKFLEEPGVVVTSTRVDINGQTFATRNVGSVKMTAQGAHPIVGVLLVVVGAAAMLGNGFLGGGLLLLGAWLCWEAFSRRSLVLVTGGGEVTALKGPKAKVERVRAAVATAIASR